MILSINFAAASSNCDSVKWKDWEQIVQHKEAVEQTDHDASLAWYSVALLLAPGKSTRGVVADCIADFVENKTGHDVRNVIWPVADEYRENVIPAHDALRHSHSVDGEVPLRSGDLYVGVGRYFKNTTPYVAESKPGDVAAANGKRELISTIEFVDSRLGEKVELRFLSMITSLADGRHRFDYSMATSAFNKGSMKYVVFWYVPLTEEFQRLHMSLKAPITAETGETARYSTESADQIAWTPALVQVFDYDRKRWLATGVASAYCSQRGITEPAHQLPENGGN
jgi:hypothetical protein